MTDIVHVENLVKRYDDLIALDHFNLSIAPGEIFGLLGPNGSGKTTSINCILQLLAYDKGTIELFGEPMTPARYDLKRRIGVCAAARWRCSTSSPCARISTISAAFTLATVKRRRALVDEATDFVGLGDFYQVPPRQALGWPGASPQHRLRYRAQARAYLFDEPTVAVDPQSRNAILEGICRLRDEGATVVYTSHYMEEVEQICSRIMIMDGGRVLAQGHQRRAQAHDSDGRARSVEVGAVEPATVERLRALEHVLSVDLSGGGTRLHLRGESAQPGRHPRHIARRRRCARPRGGASRRPSTTCSSRSPGRELLRLGAAMFNTIITTVKTLLRRPSTWVWGAVFPVALSTMFMFMFANLSPTARSTRCRLPSWRTRPGTPQPLRTWRRRLPRQATTSCLM